ncbi:hypothetical protein OBE_13158, partial [human gut metagenome]
MEDTNIADISPKIFMISSKFTESIQELVKFLADIELTEQQHYIGDQILKEIRAR